MLPDQGDVTIRVKVIYDVLVCAKDESHIARSPQSVLGFKFLS